MLYTWYKSDPACDLEVKVASYPLDNIPAVSRVLSNVDFSKIGRGGSQNPILWWYRLIYSH